MNVRVSVLVAVLVCVPVSEVIVLEIDDDVTLVLSESARQSELICQSPVRPKTSENLAKIQKHTANKTKKCIKMSVIPLFLLLIPTVKLCFRSGCQ